MNKFFSVRSTTQRSIIGLGSFIAVFVLLLILIGFSSHPTIFAEVQLLQDHSNQEGSSMNCVICRSKTEWWKWQDELIYLPPPQQTANPSPIYAASDGLDVVDWMRITYQLPSGNLGGEWQIYYHDFSRNNNLIVPLTSAGSNTQPRLSPDVKQILFVSNRDKDNTNGELNQEIYLINSDGSGERRLTFSAAADMMPAWSPDGQSIVFVSERDGNPELYRMQVDGGNQQRLTSNATADIYPAWSPDGTTIVWVRVHGQTGDLMLMDINGGNQRIFQSGLRYLARPSWSADGTQLAFDYDGNGDGFNEPYLLDLAGGSPQLISTQDLGLDEWWIGAWEPAGRSILMTNLHFVMSEEKVLVDNIQTVTVCIDFERSCEDVTPNGTYDSSPDIRSADPIPPTTAFRTLAPETRWLDDMVELYVTDQGGSALKRIDLAYRQPGDATWRWNEAGYRRGNRRFADLPDVGNLPLGEYEFRIRAEDYAGNRTPWTATIGKTFVYAKRAAGLVTDNRGIPLVNVPVSITPDVLRQSPTNDQGIYRAYLDNVDTVTIQEVRQRDDGDLDYRHDFYFKPTNNLVSYGDFEILALRGAWSAAGTLTPTIQSEIVAEGDYALRLGGLCSGLCLQRATDSPSFGEVNSVAIDDQGVVHLVGLVDQQELTYWRRDVGGQWHEPELLYSAENVSGVSAAVNRSGDLAVAWQLGTRFSSPLYLRKRSADGQWSTAQKVAGGSNPKVLLDGNGNWHLFYDACADAGVCSNTTIAHTYQLADGNASSYLFPVALEQQLTSLDTSALAVTAAGTVYFIYPEATEYGSGGRLLYRTFPPANHTWSIDKEIPIRANTVCEDLFVDHQETLHLLCIGGYTIQYRRLVPGNQWSEAEVVANAVTGWNAYSAAMDRYDTIHLFPLMDNHGGPASLPYFYKRLNGPWSRGQPLVDVDADPPWSSFGIWHVAGGLGIEVIGGSFSDFHLREIPRSTVPAESSVAKTIAIPIDLNQPTLSFMYALYGGDPAVDNPTHRIVNSALQPSSAIEGSDFVVTVTAGVTTTAVFSSATTTDWRIGWADLSGWRGEMITVTFTLRQAEGESYLQAYVDDVALGAWNTPVIESLDQTTVPAGQTTNVLLHGRNLRAGMAIRLGNENVGNVTVDEGAGTAVISIPSTMSPGVYPIYLTAGGSAYPVYSGTIFVGEQLWLPIIAR